MSELPSSSSDLISSNPENIFGSEKVPLTKIEVAIASDIGDRENQEDAGFVEILNPGGTIAAGSIADGFNKGEVVSNGLVGSIQKAIRLINLSQEFNLATFIEIHNLQFELLKSENGVDPKNDKTFKQQGSTIASVFIGEEDIFALNAGDTSIFGVSVNQSEEFVVEEISQNDGAIYSPNLIDRLLNPTKYPEKKVIDSLSSAASTIDNGFILTDYIPTVHATKFPRSKYNFIIIASDGIMPKMVNPQNLDINQLRVVYNTSNKTGKQAIKNMIQPHINNYVNSGLQRVTYACEEYREFGISGVVKKLVEKGKEFNGDNVFVGGFLINPI